MADGHPELVTLPLVYRIRHLPAGRKQAATSSVRETQVARVPSWSTEQAPIIASLFDKEGRRTSYRAVRGGDGVVRLMAAMDSAAFPRIHGNRQGEDNDGLRLFRTGLHSDNNGEPTPAAAPGMGAHLSSNRQQALANLESIKVGLAVVDGVLYAPCWEPGWQVTLDYNQVRAVKQAQAIPFRPYGFVGFCRDIETRWPELYLPEQTIARDGSLHREPIVLGHIIEHIDAILPGYADWHEVCHLAELVHSCAYKSAYNLMEAELAQIPTFAHATLLWPKTPDGELARRLVAMTRVLHAISPSNISDLLGRVTLATNRLAAAAPAMELEARLELAGVVLPALPRAIPGPAATPGGPQHG